MTQLRKFRDSISNWADEMLRGIGKRGSTFTDIDAVSHDQDTHRFLFQEFKQPCERLDPAVRFVLRDLAHLDRCTVWFIRRREDGMVGFGIFRSGKREEIITVAEWRRRFQCWWNSETGVPPTASMKRETPPQPLKVKSKSGPITHKDIRWGL